MIWFPARVRVDFFPGPEFADLYPARVLVYGLSTFILQRFVLSRSLYLPPLSVPSRGQN